MLKAANKTEKDASGNIIDKNIVVEFELY